MSKTKSQYRDHKSGVSAVGRDQPPLFNPLYITGSILQLSPEEYQRNLETTSTLYVGNLSFYTTEDQIYELFSMCGEVKRVVMGLDRMKKTPCGFCFVEYP